MKIFRYLLVALISFAAGWTVFAYQSHVERPWVYKLEAPLMLAGGDAGNPPTLLPKGTSLYFDQAYPEGFTRFRVYVNVEGIKLKGREATEKYWLDPLTAFPVDQDQLHKLLKDYPLSRQDLEAILSSGSLSQAQIRELLQKYVQ